MPVESFLQPSDAKRTVEKEVKQKPSAKELTKVESPGRPVPASVIQAQRSKTKKQRKTGKASSSAKIEKPKRDSLLILTEKPQASAKIAFSLGNPRKYSENSVPFYELEKNNEKIIVASTVGHLFNLTYTKDQKGWPIFKTEWVPSYKEKSAAFTKKYFQLLQKLEKRAKEIIMATDYDIEGEVIGWNVIRFIFKKSDAKRMKFSTLTKNELLKAYENPLPTIDWGHAYAGETRHLTDWLYGINLSRALMTAIKKTGSFKILSIGRVQGPALKLIVQREKEIQNFKPEPYWQIIALTPQAEGIEFAYPKNIFEKSKLPEFKNIKEAGAKTTKKKEKIPPPHPFDLTTLQREAYNICKISPSNTLKTAQSLYLDGLISYPRTSSQKIPKEINPEKILEELAKNFPEAKEAEREFPIEGGKTDPAHPSIYPTGEYKKLSENSEEKKVYELIVKRFISCFSKDSEVARKTITLTAENKKFVARGLSILEKGWTKIYPAKMEELSLPDLKGKVKISEIKTLQKLTQPPKRYTPASLVTTLEKKNLGTKTTRSLIIDTLYDRGYLEGKSIQATPLGVKLIEAMEKYSPIIIDENLTKDLEEKIQEIEQSKENLKQKEERIIESVEKLITDISKEFKLNERKIGFSLLEGIGELREMQKEQNTLMPCPVCKKGNLTIKYSKKTKKQFVACDNYPECRTTYSLPPNAFIKNTGKKSEEGLPLLVALRKGRKPWEFKFDPNWRDKENQKEKTPAE